MTTPIFDFSKLPGTDDAWGPSQDVPAAMKFNDVPYAPFSKTDKLGKVADWQQTKEDELPKSYQQKRRDQYHAYGASAAKLFGAEQEEDSFSIVDAGAIPVNKQTVLHGRRSKQGQQDGKQGQQYGNRRYNNGQDGRQNSQSNNQNNGRYGNQQGGQGNQRWEQNGQGNQRWNQGGNNQRWGNNRWGGRWNNNRWGSRYSSRDEQTKNRDPSLKVETEWKFVTDIEMARLTKLNLVMPKPETLSTYGTVNSYNRKYEQFKPEPLKKATIGSVENVTAIEDSVLKEYASQKQASVFTTDTALAQLMCTTRSAYSWDVVVTKQNGAIYIDKRPGSDRIEVDENAPYPPQDTNKEDINSSTKLAEEAAQIHKDFVISCLEPTVHKFENPESPIPETPLKHGYKYVKYLLPTGDEENPQPLIVRADVDSFQGPDKLISINALNQYNPTAADDWNTKLITGSRGVIFAGEVKKNNNKIARWATKAILGGLDTMKIGFVTRSDPKNNSKHVVAGVLSFTPQVLSSQISLSVGNGWGIVKSLIDIIDHEGGEQDYKFVIYKAPGVSKLAVYQVPLETFTELSQ